MSKSSLSVFTVLLVLFALQIAFAKVYSIQIKMESIGSFSDCFNFTYALFEDHNTTLPTDDTRIGIFNAVVGSDCQPTSKSVAQIKDLSSISKAPDTLNKQPNRTLYWSEEHNWNNRKLKLYPLTEIQDSLPIQPVKVQKRNTP